VKEVNIIDNMKIYVKDWTVKLYDIYNSNADMWKHITQWDIWNRNSIVSACRSCCVYCISLEYNI